MTLDSINIYTVLCILYMEHRTQIYLGKEHYQFLKGQAEKEGISLAQAVRKLIEKEMPSEKMWKKDPIWKLDKVNFRSGFAQSSRRHHEVLKERLKMRRKKLT